MPHLKTRTFVIDGLEVLSNPAKTSDGHGQVQPVRIVLNVDYNNSIVSVTGVDNGTVEDINVNIITGGTN